MNKQAEKIRLERKEKAKFLSEGWKRLQHAADRAEKRKLKLAAESKEWKLGKEAVKRNAKRKHKLQMERLQSEINRGGLI